MAQQLLCDGDTCKQLIQDGTERVDVSLPNRRDDVSGQQIPGARFNFHVPCFQAAGALLPASGVGVFVMHVPAVPAAPVPPASDETPAVSLPDPLRAPSL